MSDLVYLPSSDGSQLGDLACALPKNATAVSSEEPVTTDMGSVLGLDGLFSTFLDAAWSFAVTHCITIAEKRTIGVGGRGRQLSLLQHIRHSHETSPFNTVRTVRLLLLARDIIVSQC